MTNGNEHEIAVYQNINYTYINDTRLSSVNGPDLVGQQTSYQLNYDALGRTAVRILNGVPTYYIYDGEKPILEYRGGWNQPLASNLYGKGIDEILMRTDYSLPAAQRPYYYQSDHEGSITHLIDTNGNVLETYRYDAFGKPTINGGALTASALNNRFMFTGREYVPQFGIYEYRARAYHPGLGRFMSEDPKLFVRAMGIGKSPDDWSFGAHPDEAEFNLFRYCGNDPIDFTDPMGEFTFPVIDAAFIAYDIYAVATDSEHRGENWTALGLDVASAVIPGVSGAGKLYKAERVAQRAAQARRALEAGKLTKWGWQGSKAWRDAAKALNKGGTIENIGGKIPSKQEALDLLKQAGATVKRIQEGHAPPNPHTYPHINFETASGKKGTIQVGSVLPQPK